MRCIPLLFRGTTSRRMQKKIATGTPLLNVNPFVRKTMGIVTTGSKYLKAALKDAFTPIIEGTLCRVWCE